MLKDTIREQFNEGRKQGDRVKKSCFEAVLNKILYAEKSGKYPLPLADDIVVGLIQKEIKELEEAIEPLTPAAELFQENTVKLGYLRPYLPAMLTEEEVRSYIREDIAAVGKNLGVIMRTLIQQVGNRYDKSKLKDLVQEEINKG